MKDDHSLIEHKFRKSRLNASTESKAHAFVLQDRRFQKPDAGTKKAILQKLGLTGGTWSHRSFDLIMTETPAAEEIATRNLDRYIDDISLIEVKSTRSGSVKDLRLNGFFYGSTKNQYDLADAAGDRLLFAFVVLTDTNAYGKPFFVLVPFSEVELKTHRKRTQYQVNFRTDMTAAGDVQARSHSPIDSSRRLPNACLENHWVARGRSAAPSPLPMTPRMAQKVLVSVCLRRRQLSRTSMLPAPPYAAVGSRYSSAHLQATRSSMGIEARALETRCARRCGLSRRSDLSPASTFRHGRRRPRPGSHGLPRSR